MMETSTGDERRGTVARWVAEIFVITLGILLAFGVDASWSRLQESEQEQLNLQALSVEFRSNAASLRATAQGHAAVAEAGAKLLARTGPTASDTEGVLALIGDIWTPWHAELASGVVASLLSTEDLARIRDPALRQALAAWPDRVAALTREEDRLHDRLTDELLPTIQGSVAQIDIEFINGFATLPKLRDEFATLVGPSRFDSDFSELLRDRRFENLLVDRVTVSMIVRDMTVGLAVEADRILDLLTSSLQE